MKYVPHRDKAPLKGATIQTTDLTTMRFVRPAARAHVELMKGEGYLYTAGALEELADGLRLLAADMRDDALR